MGGGDEYRLNGHVYALWCRAYAHDSGKKSACLSASGYDVRLNDYDNVYGLIWCGYVCGYAFR